MKKILEHLRKMLDECYINDTLRKKLIFTILNIILALTCIVMSIINIFTQEFTLLYMTAIYAILFTVNAILGRKYYNVIIEWMFVLEAIVLLSMFIISGIPDGFASLWTLLIPCCTLAIFGRREGSIYSGIMLTIIIFFFWCPTGRSFIASNNYTTTFMLRYPFLYLCVYLISYFIEVIRRKTHEKLLSIENNYKWLYKHDQLTNMYNRHAFHEEANKLFAYNPEHETAVLMIDIDDFKKINDMYGHNLGDDLLVKLAKTIQEYTCEHCISCRWGGEEFILMMKCEHDPLETAERLRVKCSALSLVAANGEEVRFTISIGISIGMVHNKNQLTAHIYDADNAMYLSKHKGKNQITVVM